MRRKSRMPQEPSGLNNSLSPRTPPTPSPPTHKHVTQAVPNTSNSLHVGTPKRSRQPVALSEEAQTQYQELRSALRRLTAGRHVRRRMRLHLPLDASWHAKAKTVGSGLAAYVSLVACRGRPAALSKRGVPPLERQVGVAEDIVKQLHCPAGGAGGAWRAAPCRRTAGRWTPPPMVRHGGFGVSEVLCNRSVRDAGCTVSSIFLPPPLFPAGMHATIDRRALCSAGRGLGRGHSLAAARQHGMAHLRVYPRRFAPLAR